MSKCTKSLAAMAILCAMNTYPVLAATYQGDINTDNGLNGGEYLGADLSEFKLKNAINNYINTDNSSNKTNMLSIGKYVLARAAEASSGNEAITYKKEYVSHFPITEAAKLTFNSENGKFIPAPNGTTGEDVITFSYQKEYGNKDSATSTKKFVWNIDSDNKRTLVENNSAANPDVIYHVDSTRLGSGRIATDSTTFTGTSINKDFVDNAFSETQGGAIYHTKSNLRLDSITGDFVNNTIAVSSGGINGGLIYSIDSNDTGTSGIGLIKGDFINNTVDNIPASVQGGLIAGNSTSGIGKIEGNFIGNKISSLSYINGGTIYNYQDKVIGIKNIDGTEVGATDAIVGNFIGNTAESYNETLGSTNANAFGGAISNRRGLINGNIKGSFVENGVKTANGAARGGVLYTEGDGFDVTNGEGRIYGNIEGDFIGNYAVSENREAEGGAIYAQIATISGDITNGNFIGNRAEGGTSAKAGAIYLSGSKNSVRNIESDFIRNQATATSGRADGGAVNTSAKIYGNLSSDFIENKAEGSTIAQAGALYSSTGIQGSVTGNYSGNSAIAHSDYARGGAIYNQGIIGYNLNYQDGYEVTGKLNANFYNNLVKSDSKDAEGGALFNSSSGTYQYPNGYISAIEGEFIGNSAQAGGSANGGAIYNNSKIGSETSTTPAIKGAFSSNTASGSAGANGGAIYNKGNIYGIKGTGTGFSDNSITCTGAVTAYGGAIYNSGKIEGIEADFSNNSATSTARNVYGGAIYSAVSSTLGISSIKGEFSENKALAKASGVGGAIAFYNSSGSSEVLINDSKFSKNLAEGTTSANGGAVYVQTKSGSSLKLNIASNEFIENSAVAKASRGGAIYTDSNTIAIIDNSNFKGNKTTSNTTLEENNITGGGAVFNNGGNLIFKDTSFENNNSTGETAQGGAIYNTNNSSKAGTISIIAQEKDVLFNGNIIKQNADSEAVSNAIYNNGGIINLNAAADKKIEFNDSIVAVSGSVLNINKEGEWNSDTDKVATGAAGIPINAPTGGKIVMNADMSGLEGNINLHGGTVEFKENSKFFNPAQIAVEKETKINLINNKSEDINFKDLILNDNLKLGIDADLNANKSDKLFADSITAAADKGIIISDLNLIVEGNIQNINIASDSIKDHITLAQNADLNITGATENYLLSYNKESGNIRILSAESLPISMQNAHDGDIFGMKRDETVTIPLGSPNANNYGINGGGNSIIGESVAGFEIGTDKSLGLTNIKSIEGFESENGGAVNNKGVLNIKDTSFKNNTAVNEGGAINNAAGAKTTITADKTDVVFEGNKDVTGSNAISNNGGEVTLNAENKTIVLNDAILNKGEGKLALNAQNGDIILNEIITDADGGKLTLNAQKGNIHFKNKVNGADSSLNTIEIKSSADSQGAVKFSETVSNHTINQTDGIVNFVDNGGFDNTVQYNLTSGTISLASGTINTANLGNVNLLGDVNLKLDAKLQDRLIDQITADSFDARGHKLNIDEIIVLQPTTDKEFSLNPLEKADSSIKEAMAGAMNYTGGDIVLSPIYRYKVDFDNESGLLKFGLASQSDGNTPTVNDFNPAVLSAPVAAQTGGYLVQLNSYDQAFINTEARMMLPRSVRIAQTNADKYAISDGYDAFEASASQEYRDGWTRPYSTFEKVNLRRGVKVENIMYGSFFGTDSKIHQLKNGKEAQFGMYIGYNGSHQNYETNSIYQNGGTLGFSGTLYKGNAFTSLTANAGAASVMNSTMYGNETFPMLMAGIASKSGFNMEFKDGRFIIQPTFMMSYSYVNTFDYTNAAGVRIGAEPLHAIQLSPGIKFLGNTKTGWQPYFNVAMKFNIMDKTNFKANTISLPELAVRPFVEYGFGLQKAFTGNYGGYLQAMVRNGGRNGVALSGGFNFLVGKDNL